MLKKCCVGVCLLACGLLTGCAEEKQGTTGDSPAKSGPSWVILDTRTDDFDRAKAKKLAQEAMTKYPDLGCMVGLFEYNPPILLDAVKEAGRLKEIKIVGFDENDRTLQGIIDGDVEGTIVQDPYNYGYKSVEMLAKVARGEKDAIPESGFLDIPARSIVKDNVQEFWEKLKQQTGKDGAAPKDAPRPVANNEGEKIPKVAWVTNGIADFWTIGEKGANDAAKAVNCEVVVRMPAKGLIDQKQIVQQLLTDGIDGIAISPIDPDNQGDVLKEVSDQTTLITHDSDAPKSGRKCYIGMDNYTAGRMCGKLVRQALPKGGSVMVFVGRLGQLNARQRRQGLIDELLSRSHDPSRYDAPGAEIR